MKTFGFLVAVSLAACFGAVVGVTYMLLNEGEWEGKSL